MLINFGPPPQPTTPKQEGRKASMKEADLNTRIRVKGKLGKLLRYNEGFAYVLCDGEVGISYVPVGEIEKV